MLTGCVRIYKMPMPIVWILIDTSNGDEGIGQFNYCWFFPTKKLALEHKKRVKKLRYGATLNGPYKYKKM